MTSSLEGGAIKAGAANVYNSMFWGNSARGAAAISLGGGSITNCTFSGQMSDGSCDTADGGVISTGLSTVVTNCIVWGNFGVATFGCYNGSPRIPIVTYSGMPESIPGVGNLRVDPFFASLNGNLRLRSGSPCIDAGNNAALPADAVTDADGNPRFLDDPGTLDTGAGTSPIVDMGAYEFGSGSPAPVDADLDQDGDVDLQDFRLFQSVFDADGYPQP